MVVGDFSDAGGGDGGAVSEEGGDVGVLGWVGLGLVGA